MALIANTKASANGSNGTSPAIDTSGANLIVIVQTGAAGNHSTPTDSKGNTWIPLTERISANLSIRLYYCLNPTVGAGHTFTAVWGSGSYATIAVLAFSDIRNEAPTESGAANDSATTLQPGPITPAEADSLLVTGFQFVDSVDPGSASIDSGFTIADNIAGTYSGIGTASAYKILSASSAHNPTWSSNLSAERLSAAMACFRLASAPTITTTSLPNGTVGVPYDWTGLLNVAGGTGSITWTLVSGSLPTGFGMLPTSGSGSAGTPTAAGTYNFTLRATDAASAYDEQALSIIINAAPTLPTTNWTALGLVPRAGMIQWVEADLIAGVAGGGSVTTVPDISGNARDLAVASNKPTLSTNVINGYPAVYFNGSRNPLAWIGNVAPKHVFVVAAYEDAAFPSGDAGYATLLASATSSVGGDVLVGQPSSSRFFDFDYDAGGAYQYRRRDVPFAEGDMQAAFSNQISIFEITRATGFNMDAIQVGKQAAFPARLWKGFWVGHMLWNRILEEHERFAVYSYLAMKYRLWRRVASGKNVFPFQPNWSFSMPTGKVILESRSNSGARKARQKGVKTRARSLKFETRIAQEHDAAEAFWDEHHPASTFIYRDDAYSPPRDSEVRFIGDLDAARNDYNDIDYALSFEDA